MRVFLEQLFRDGRVTVPAAAVPWNFDADAERWVLEFDRSARLSLQGAAPALHFTVACWTAELLAKAVRLAISRDGGVDEIARAFTVRCSAPRSPSVDYSVDLFLRYLPEVLALARRLAASDPLVGVLKHIAAQWPLSSVGIPELIPATIDPFIGDDALRRLYVDRIIAQKDTARLTDPRVAEAFRAATGDHAELAPAFARD